MNTPIAAISVRTPTSKTQIATTPSSLSSVSSKKSAFASFHVYKGARNSLGLKHGYGVLNYGNGGIYEGNFVNGTRQGVGKLVFPNGDIYDGEWMNNKMDGKCIYRYHDGSMYIGDYKDNMKNGSGIWKLSTGDIYDGLFIDDNMASSMRYIFNHGNSMYVGEFNHRSNVFHGHGKLTTTTINGSDIYDGQFKDGMKSGDGTMIFSNGDIFFGKWDNDSIGNYGKMQLQSGDTYEGALRNGKYHGLGTYVWKDGSYYKGYFKAGIRLKENMLCGSSKDEIGTNIDASKKKPNKEKKKKKKKTTTKKKKKLLVRRLIMSDSVSNLSYNGSTSVDDTHFTNSSISIKTKPNAVDNSNNNSCKFLSTYDLSSKKMKMSLDPTVSLLQMKDWDRIRDLLWLCGYPYKDSVQQGQQVHIKGRKETKDRRGGLYYAAVDMSSMQEHCVDSLKQMDGGSSVCSVLAKHSYSLVKRVMSFIPPPAYGWSRQSAHTDIYCKLAEPYLRRVLPQAVINDMKYICDKTSSSSSSSSEVSSQNENRDVVQAVLRVVTYLLRLVKIDYPDVYAEAIEWRQLIVHDTEVDMWLKEQRLHEYCAYFSTLGYSVLADLVNDCNGVSILTIDSVIPDFTSILKPQHQRQFMSMVQSLRC